jgi:hypothetical protein
VSGEEIAAMSGASIEAEEGQAEGAVRCVGML